MDKGEDPYKILGVSSNTSSNDIKKSYRKLALKHHPDRGGDQVQFSKISNAYEILSDPEQRQNYDLQQKHGHNVGYDPNGPTYTNTSSDYDPSSSSSQAPRKSPTTRTSTYTNEEPQWTYTYSKPTKPKKKNTYTTTSSSP
jgi:DnaJ-class molecular chaperone